MAELLLTVRHEQVRGPQRHHPRTFGACLQGKAKAWHEQHCARPEPEQGVAPAWHGRQLLLRCGACRLLGGRGAAGANR